MIYNQAQIDAYKYHDKVAKALVASFWAIRRWFPAHRLPRMDSWSIQGERGLKEVARSRYVPSVECKLCIGLDIRCTHRTETLRTTLPPLKTWAPRIEHERPTDAALDRIVSLAKSCVNGSEKLHEILRKGV